MIGKPRFITVTHTQGWLAKVNVARISYYFQYVAGSSLVVGNTTIPVAETPEQIDQLIEAACD